MRKASLPVVLFRLFLIICSFLVFLNTAPCFAAEEPKSSFDPDNPANYTPMADIVDIVEKSGHFDYHDTFFDRNNLLKDYKSTLKFADINQVFVESGGARKIDVYRPKDTVLQFIKQAQDLKLEQKVPQAEESLKMAIQEDPNYSMTHVFLGKLYLDSNRYSDALMEFNRAIKLNPANYTAFKMRAATYHAMGDLGKCRDDFIQALILNRNDEETWQSLKDLGNKMGYIVYDTPFIPLYSLQKMENGKVRIYLDTDEIIRWMPYGFCKAVWLYEPGYFEKKTGEKEYRHTELEEMESVNNMLWAYNAFKIRGRVKQDALLDRMEKIKARYFLKEFVYFEILSPTRPDLIATLDEKHFEDMKDYVDEFILVRDPKLMKKLGPIKNKQTFPIQ